MAHRSHVCVGNSLSKEKLLFMRMEERTIQIYGIQKLTLLDYPGKVACTVFTGGCNLRCPFCHNASIVTELSEAEPIGEDEIFSFLKKRRNVLDGVCVTGGEPLLQSDIGDFIRKIKRLGYLVKLDTNGCFPEEMKALVSEKLIDYIAMDIKSSPEDYPKAVGVEEFDVSKIKESISFLLSSGVDYEFRTTVVKGLHTGRILTETAQSISGAKRYFLQKFVDSGDLIGSGMSAFSDSEMKAFLEIVSPYVKSAALRGI